MAPAYACAEIEERAIAQEGANRPKGSIGHVFTVLGLHVKQSEV